MGINSFESVSAASALPSAGVAGGTAWTAWLENGIRALADEVVIDGGHTIIAKIGGGGRPLVFLAHTDARGFVVTAIEKSGAIRFMPTGYLEEKGLVGTRVRLESGLKGVITAGFESGAGAKPAAGGGNAFGNLFIDVGAKNAEEAAASVRAGDRVVRDAAPFDGAGSGGCVTGAVLAFDANLVGARILLETMSLIKAEGAPENPLVFLFRPAGNEPFTGISAYEGLDAEAALAVGAYHIGGADGTEGPDDGISIGAGPVAAAKGGLYFSPAVYGAVVDAAARRGIALQHSVTAYTLAEADELM
ncbi:MAG: hypothetical protein LBC58_06505, partial [Clostridiales Family XIII bacterium]|nr:hypothetical protein [Clostridiales Family XIII bacterium]